MQPLYNMVPSCNAPIGPASTSALSGILGPRTTGGAINFGVSSVQCTSQDVEVLPNAGAIDRALYCGFHQASKSTADEVVLSSCRLALCWSAPLKRPVATTLSIAQITVCKEPKPIIISSTRSTNQQTTDNAHICSQIDLEESRAAL
jgi:hypothetical protein